MVVHYNLDSTINEAKSNPVITVPEPRTLSKTAFMDHVVAQLMAVNDSTMEQALARFIQIMNAAKTSSDLAVQFAYERYVAADVFEKTNTETLTAIMVADATTGHLEANERAAITGNWPT